MNEEKQKRGPGNPNFKPKWVNLPTKQIRVPTKFAPLLEWIARLLDRGEVSPTWVRSWLSYYHKHQKFPTNFDEPPPPEEHTNDS